MLLLACHFKDRQVSKCWQRQSSHSLLSTVFRCWITLGLAIRLAQSVGLHVDLKAAKKDRNVGDSESETQETRRRVWYSLYVLDRLVALQLGRPPAISDEDCYVSLPSRVDDSNHDWDAEPLPVISTEEKSVGEYFVRVIEFSSILGRVLRDLCNPHRKFVEKLEETRNLDEIILSWKQRLPRYLRFDIGHAFEKSVTYKRQASIDRNFWLEVPIPADIQIEKPLGNQVSPHTGLDTSPFSRILTSEPRTRRIGSERTQQPQAMLRASLY